MAQTVFLRYEKKYLLSVFDYRLIRERLADRMSPGPYGTYQLFNLYLDTEQDELIRRSLDKPAYKEKLRLRSYVLPQNGRQSVFLEIKKKYKGIVSKRRISLYLADFQSYCRCRAAGRSIPPRLCEMVSAADHPESSRQIMREIDAMFDRMQLMPRLYLAYDREELIGIEDTAFRLTFDWNIRSRRTDLGFERGDYGEPLLEPSLVLMESKLPGATPLWFSKLLSEQGIYPTSFSKYGSVFEQERLLEQKQVLESDRSAGRDTPAGCAGANSRAS